jgi:hypothetical protein
MRTIRKICSCFCLTLSLALLTEAKEWRGIVPLHTNRAEVERLLGTSDGVGSGVYKLENEVVFIQYSGKPCETGETYSWNVLRNTVINISVSPRVLPRFADLQLDLSRYKEKDDPEVGGYTYYIDEEEGHTYDVTNGLVMSIGYTPAAKDRNLRCLCPGVNKREVIRSDVRPCKMKARSRRQL